MISKQAVAVVQHMYNFRLIGSKGTSQPAATARLPVCCDTCAEVAAVVANATGPGIKHTAASVTIRKETTCRPAEQLTPKFLLLLQRNTAGMGEKNMIRAIPQPNPGHTCFRRISRVSIIAVPAVADQSSS
jgi:hypothetical protein